MQRARAESDLPERGIHEEPYRQDGCLVLVAIDSRGEARKRVKLLPGVSYDRAEAWLWQLLDRVDPIDLPPKLELVRDTPAARGGRKVHPAHENDYPAYRRRLIRQLSHRVHRFRD